jgi:hypothetical protein
MNTKLCLFLAVFAFSAPIAHAQYLEPGDINVFINGFDKIKAVLNEYGDEEENEDWIAYNGLAKKFSTATEEYVKGPARKNDLNNLRNIYQEMVECNVPGELGEALRLAGWERNGNKKLVTITMGWSFLYAAKEMEKETKDIPRALYKLFVEKYYVRLTGILEIFNGRDLELIGGRVEEIKNVMILPGTEVPDNSRPKYFGAVMLGGTMASSFFI